MDIDILLGLQEFRNGIGSCMAEFMSKMTFLGELSTLFVIIAVMYWCIDKDYGTYLMMGFSGNRLANGLLKISVCAFRPWIRDARIIPYGNATSTATGYSFPSGHTMNAATIFGGTAVRKDLPGVLRVVSFVVMVLIGLSRNYLGVHTPQDVLVGMVVGLLVMWLVSRLMRWIAAHPEKDWIVVCVGLFLAAGIAVFAAVKGYPDDRDAEGNLLVDGAKMALDTFKGVGWCSAFLIGWILERRFVGFTTDVTPLRRFIRLVVGILSYYAVALIVVPLIKNWISGAAGTLISCFLQMFYITFIFPWFIRRFEKAEEPKAVQAA